MGKLDNLTNMDELRRLLEAQKSGAARSINDKEMAQKLKERVIGQDHVVDDLAKLIRLQWAKEKRKRPIANLLFLGPTGTGKTELAKAMAEYLYGDEKAMLQFACSEFTGPESKNHLIGVPTGYHGAGQGGKLTRPMLNNPKRLVLFDEVEKAYQGVFDLFLQMMGDGRLTEPASGDVADFTQSIILLTSNAEENAIVQLQKEISDEQELANAAKSHLVACGTFRAEIMGRVDKIYIFKQLSEEVRCDIIKLKMYNLAQSYGLELEYVDARIVIDALQRSNKLLKYGARALEQVIDGMLAPFYVAAREEGAKRVRMEMDASGDYEVVRSA